MEPVPHEGEAMFRAELRDDDLADPASVSVKEIAAPFPQSDLTGVFNRLSLNLPAYCRRWAFSLPWSTKDEVPVVLRALRLGQTPLDLLSL